MLRMFAEHAVRRVESLDGLWKLWSSTKNGLVKCRATVPGVWNRVPALADHRGEVSYERKVQIHEAGDYMIRIGSVSTVGTVVWDGTRMGWHCNAYTAFGTVLRDMEPGEHGLQVMVNNEWSKLAALHFPNDYETYGGITRGVELHKLAGAYIERMAFHAEKTGEAAYRAVVRVHLCALHDMKDLSVTLSLAGGEARAVVGGMEAGERREIGLEFDVRGVKEWDVLDAHLYALTANLYAGEMCIDDLIDRVGFRTVKIEGEKILLNGRPVKIRGFNRHEDHALFGSAVPEQAMMDDINLMLDMGANAVRTSHYPNDPRFLDMCDEAGLLVWEEHHARAAPGDLLRSYEFKNQERRCNEEMVAQHVNHPCIFIWGVLNECESETPEGRAVYAEHLAHLRELDPTRPVSYASCRFFADICHDLVDVVSWNVYPGWYHGEGADAYIRRLAAWSDGHGAAGKPMLITEVGAGAVAGYHDPFGKTKWSEERQCALLREQLTAILGNPRLSGVFIWQFADVRVAEEWAMHRPKQMNNKGVVDGCRSPKMSYFTVKEIFTEDAKK